MVDGDTGRKKSQVKVGKEANQSTTAYAGRGIPLWGVTSGGGRPGTGGDLEPGRIDARSGRRALSELAWLQGGVGVG